MAGFTRNFTHKAFKSFAGGIRVCLSVTTRNKVHDPLVGRVVGTLASVSVLKLHMELRIGAIENRLTALRAELRPRGVEVDPSFFGERLKQSSEIFTDGATRPRSYCPFI